MKPYGWLRLRAGSWAGGAGGGGPTGYDYGWPSGGSAESDVVLQYLLDESSGNITDEVNSIVMTPSGTMDYERSVGGDWANLSPGIRMMHDGGTWEGFRNAAAQSAIDIGTDDFVAECVGVIESGDTYGKSIFQDINANGWSWNSANLAGTQANIYLRADDGTSVNLNIAYADAAVIDDDTVHKHRITGDRDGNLELFLDGVSQGTGAISALDGKTISSQRPSLGMKYNTDTPFNGTMYEFRLTVGNATNNSGGPGGG